MSKSKRGGNISTINKLQDCRKQLTQANQRIADLQAKLDALCVAHSVMTPQIFYDSTGDVLQNYHDEIEALQPKDES